MPLTSVCRVLRRRILMKPYKIPLLQGFHEGDRVLRVAFGEFILSKIKVDENFVSRLVFSDEATFHLNHKVNRHNASI